MCEMKHSGVEWIGKIPSQWKICRLKNYARIMNGQDYQTVIADDGQYPVIGSGGPFARANAYLYDVESVLLGRKGTIDKPIYINRPFWTVDTMYYTEIQDTAFGKYLYYLCTQIEFGYYQYGSAVPSMTQRDLNNVRFPMPTIQEQQRIADYLDAKCAKIDALIAKQQEIIEKLKAYKLSVITEAVTKGLNPATPMKDSGISWLGDIPAHWEFRRTKSMAFIVDCKNRTPENIPDGEYTVVRTTCIKDGKFSYEGSFQTDYNNYTIWTERGAPKAGDVFFTREAPMGEACMVPNADNLCMGQRVMYFRPFDDVDGRFILYSIYGPLVREYIESKSKGSTVGHLKLGQVADLPMLYCPYDEQVSICDYLDRKCQKIDNAVQKKQQIVDRLLVYKKYLIYEVVTGKREV